MAVLASAACHEGPTATAPQVDGSDNAAPEPTGSGGPRNDSTPPPGDSPPDTDGQPTAQPCDGTWCGSLCIDTTSDARHCGQCERSCPQGQRCSDAQCEDGAPTSTSSLAALDGAGALVYGRYAAEGEANEDHRLPDFSFAGYLEGGVAIPSAEVKRTVSPGEGDDRSRIQEAIDYVASLPRDERGLRGAVLLERGTYEVGDSLRITADGVVLRGEGEGLDGTILVATRAEKHDFINVVGGGTGFGEVSGTRVPVRSSYAAVGSTQLELDRAPDFKPGDTIVIMRTPNAEWIDALGMAQWGWTAGSYEIGHERKVVRVEGNLLTFDIPLVDSLAEVYGGGYVFLADMDSRISHTGVEDLRIQSAYTRNDDEDHGWAGITFSRTVNSWVRRVVVQYFADGAVVMKDQSSFNTVEDVFYLDPKGTKRGGTRYGFNIEDGIGNLFQRCYARNARHNFVTGGRVTGPNVWLDCMAVNNINDDGPHHRWATGLLFDNTSSAELHVQNRASSGSGHGWAGAQVMFWNARADSIICDAPVGSMNWAVGCEGEHRKSSRSNEADGWLESQGRPVEPRSLYLQQLQDRLGREAVAAVSTPEQRQGRVWEAISARARTLSAPPAPGTDPQCELGIYYDLVCCAASCGACDGSDECADRPGGESACCEGAIRADQVSCSVSAAPCLVD